MTNKTKAEMRTENEKLIAEYLTSGNLITKCPTRTVASNDNRKFHKLGYSRDAARVCRLNMLAA
jgi:hypothetical protein